MLLKNQTLTSIISKVVFLTYLPPKNNKMLVAKTSVEAQKMSNILRYMHNKFQILTQTNKLLLFLTLLFSEVHIFRQPFYTDDVMWCNRWWSNGSANSWTFSTCTQIDHITFTLEDMPQKKKSTLFGCCTVYYILNFRPVPWHCCQYWDKKMADKKMAIPVV